MHKKKILFFVLLLVRLLFLSGIFFSCSTTMSRGSMTNNSNEAETSKILKNRQNQETANLAEYQDIPFIVQENQEFSPAFIPQRVHLTAKLDKKYTMLAEKERVEKTKTLPKRRKTPPVKRIVRRKQIDRIQQSDNKNTIDVVTIPLLMNDSGVNIRNISLDLPKKKVVKRPIKKDKLSPFQGEKKTKENLPKKKKNLSFNQPSLKKKGMKTEDMEGTPNISRQDRLQKQLIETGVKDTTEHDNINTQQQVYARLKNEFSVVLVGLGWTFLGSQRDSAQQESIFHYLRLEKGVTKEGNNKFVFFADALGTDILTFERFDLQTGKVYQYTISLVIEKDIGVTESAMKETNTSLEKRKQSARKDDLTQRQYNLQMIRQQLKEKDIPSLLKSLKGINDFRGFEAELLLDIVEFLLHRGVYDEVGQMLTESNIQISQEELPRFYYLLGMWYEQARNMKKAVMYYDTVIKLYPLSEYYEAALHKRERVYRYYLHIR